MARRAPHPIHLIFAQVTDATLLPNDLSQSYNTAKGDLICSPTNPHPTPLCFWILISDFRTAGPRSAAVYGSVMTVFSLSFNSRSWVGLGPCLRKGFESILVIQLHSAFFSAGTQPGTKYLASFSSDRWWFFGSFW